MLKAILCDFDGLVIDTEVEVFKAMAGYLRQHFEYELEVLEFLLCVGSDDEALLAKLAGKGICLDRAHFLQSIYEEVHKNAELLPAKEGVEDFLREARTLGLRISLATSSKKEKPMKHLKRLGLLPLYDAVITADDVEKIKPHPDLFLKAARTLGVANHECLVVEDSKNGLEAAKAAGMRALVVPNAVTKYCEFEGEYLKKDSLKGLDLGAILRAW